MDPNSEARCRGRCKKTLKMKAGVPRSSSDISPCPNAICIQLRSEYSVLRPFSTRVSRRKVAKGIHGGLLRQAASFWVRHLAVSHQEGSVWNRKAAEIFSTHPSPCACVVFGAGLLAAPLGAEEGGSARGRLGLLCMLWTPQSLCHLM